MNPDCCENCEFWDQPSWDNPKLRLCNHDTVDTASEDSVNSVDTEPYTCGRVATGPKFRCVHFKAKLTA